MLRVIAGVVVGAVGAYLLSEAESSNSRARDDYDDSVKRAKRKTQKAYQNAQRRDSLDKLFKVKRAKQEIADSIYHQLKSSQSDFREINSQLKESKETLSALFVQKKSLSTREEKRAIQQNINLIIEARRELFEIKDGLKSDIAEFKSRLREANQETRNIQVEIDRVRGS